MPDLPKSVDVLAAAFCAEVGRRKRAVQVPGGGYVWYDVDQVTPSRERSLDEVKDQVEERWRDDQIAARSKTKATEMVDKIKAGGSFAEVAAANGLKVENAAASSAGEADRCRPPPSRKSFARRRTASRAPRARSRPSGSCSA